MIYVLGSINRDFSFLVSRMPTKGETLAASGFYTGAGGKGLNQAVAAAKIGADVAMIGRAGETDGDLKQYLHTNRVNVDNVTLSGDGGKAMILRCEGDNRIVIHHGANYDITASEVERALEGAGTGDALLCQLEVPLPIVCHALKVARKKGVSTVLNPAPAYALDPEIYENCDVIIPNETETEILTDINPRSATKTERAIRELHSRGVRYVIITQGAHGSTASDAKMIKHIPPRKVDAVDTTGAGDTFVGAFTFAYPMSGKLSFFEACKFATLASSITVTRVGGAESIPTLAEVEELYNNNIAN